MNNLSQELIEQICESLPGQDLKSTLTVSRAFQYASEKASGAFTTFDLTKENANQFINRYGGRRWGYLRHVRFRVLMYSFNYEDEDGTDPEGKHRCRESAREIKEKDQELSNQIRFLFVTLKQLENSVGEGRMQVTIYAPVREVVSLCPHRKCVSWRLRMLSPENLPELGSVRALSIEDPAIVYPLESETESLLKIDLRVLVDLAIKFPRLEFLGSKLDAGSGWTTDLESSAARHYSRIWAGPLRDSRNDFAKAVESASLPKTLRQAQLDFLFPLSSAERIDQSEPLPDLVSPAPYDPFSSSLSIIIQRLRRLELKVVADATLLWPVTGLASYPNLESICVVLHMATPSGRWYFQGPDGNGHDSEGFKVLDDAYPPMEDTAEDKARDEEIEDDGLDTETSVQARFRVHPNDDVLVPFLTSFGKAACEMPALKEACLWIPLSWAADESWGDASQISRYPDRPLGWGITYIAPKTFGFHPFPGQHYASTRQLWWTTGAWRPSEELRHLYQQIGNQNIELLEYWGHEQYGCQLLALRPIFDEFQIFGRRHPNNPWRVGKQ